MKELLESLLSFYKLITFVVGLCLVLWFARNLGYLYDLSFITHGGGATLRKVDSGYEIKSGDKILKMTMEQDMGAFKFKSDDPQVALKFEIIPGSSLGAISGVYICSSYACTDNKTMATWKIETLWAVLK